MAERCIDLNQREWAEVARAFRDAVHRAPSPAPRPGTAAAFLARLTTFLLGPSPIREPDTPRRQALRDFFIATVTHRHVAEELVPGLLSFGLSRTQIDALVMLLLPGRAVR